MKNRFGNPLPRRISCKIIGIKEMFNKNVRNSSGELKEFRHLPGNQRVSMVTVDVNGIESLN